ncbi:A24 family peptidase [Methylotuvimicrobium alcaliphilum]|uniref:Peptidase A24A, prepilin type IV n=1 Tax=Methylotuvimicrobium alcaliphilum (strain DSM 19304 / NCIMB 14124 / VKM B-2133 / 20Z) TaxID=1091494 RepID=G4T3P2_META2|nr:prepilin peptidase [Methylotuvimicrobium alcaliphilum]CCE24848.1 Peptidase A24A, prepilin type IV [Methylotuvimicrobium alcaliphilum 20Z]
MNLLAAASVPIWILGVWAVVCGLYDLVRRRLPNKLTLGAHLAALAAYAVIGEGWLGLTFMSALAGWALALVMTLPGYVFKKLGAGDVKLFAAMGLLGGVDAVLITFVVAGLLSGVTVILWLTAYRWSFLLVRLGISLAGVPEPKGRFLPFGAALAAGFLVALFAAASGFSLSLRG